MSRAKKTDEADLLAALKKGIMSVLNNPNAEPAEIMKAIEVGAKLLLIESKIGDDGNKSTHFFDR